MNSQSPSLRASPHPTTTPSFLPTPVNNVVLQPRITDPPSSSTCPPNTLLIEISTTLPVTDFARFYSPNSIETFEPSYVPLEDGSLITPPFQQDLVDANLSLLVTGALAMLFLRNIIVSGDYLRRGKVKKKILFYVLFASQILAPVGLIPVIVSYFNQTVNCTVVIVLSCLSGTTSLALLITVILGVKAYKCLNHPRFVPVILGLFQVASTAMVILDVVTTRGIRRLTGSCIRNNDLRLTRYFVSVQFLESLFICCCFLYVCWKSRGSAAARGRISVQLSMNDLPIEFPEQPNQQPQPARRGWWDYVAEERPANSAQNTERNAKGGLFSTLRRPQVISNEKVPATDPSSRHSLAPSSMSRISRLFPRMELFQEVMKDELFYTTFITSTCVIVAVLSVIGVNFKNGLSVTGWIALNWGIISVLAIHSFGRVVHRHERDTLLHHPVTCTAIMRAANDMVKKDDQHNRGALSISTTRRTNRRVNKVPKVDSDDPFADTQPLDQKKPLESHMDRNSTLSISTSETTSSSERSLSPKVGQTSSRFSVTDLDLPTSNLGTPLVPLDPSNNAQQRGFSRSWLLDRNSVVSLSESEKSFQRDHVR
ncbi:hypothetical protein CVT24_011535 [Panaeolus cyanescens]|uniref:Uncharacterized protein n=1 Tax=Panaeolus cyanescens TaxID=181874 RepID=A0A409VM57_9AGAR|nr:hypothetical protein CVT24_011535 [Panaeolus cyanescens]